jgi:hypothetical protein
VLFGRKNIKKREEKGNKVKEKESRRKRVEENKEKCNVKRNNTWNRRKNMGIKYWFCSGRRKILTREGMIRNRYILIPKKQNHGSYMRFEKNRLQ